MIRHLATSADPRTSACGGVWFERSALSDVRAADRLEDVTCRQCRGTDAYARLVAVLAASHRQAGALLARQQEEIRGLRAALRDAAEMHEARGLAKTAVVEAAPQDQVGAA